MNPRSKLIIASISFVLLAAVNIGETRATSISGNGNIYILKERPCMNVVNINDFFGIQLKENISTGYSWQYKISNPGVVKGLEIIRKNKNQTTLHRVGASSECMWEFQGIEAGKSQIEFKYYRSWEGEKSAIESRIYDVTITNK
jgi:predicted secreted protein